MQEAATEEHPPNDVVVLFDPKRKESVRGKVTRAEVEEYRKIKPQLLTMLREWEKVKGSGGCPVAGMIVDDK